MHQPPALPQLDHALLNEIVGRALGSNTAVVNTWQIEPIPHTVINHVSAGLFRVNGQADVDGRAMDWSLILKIMHLSPASRSGNWAASDDPAHYNYWKREFLAYQSGILQPEGRPLAVDLLVPRSPGFAEQAGQIVWLWLEQIEGLPASEWTLERYGLAARHLGQMQGAYLAERPLPDAPWLSRHWLRQRLDGMTSQIMAGFDAPGWQHPLLRQVFPADQIERVRQLWQQRHHLLAALDQLPQTLCHLDFWPPNLFARRSAQGREQTVAIDWSYVGIGAIGQDIGNLVPDSIWTRYVATKRLTELERLVCDGYIEGLHDSGYPIDPRQARLGYQLSAALGFGFLTHWLPQALTDETMRAWIIQRYGLPVEQLIEPRARLLRHVLDLADQARAALQR